MENASNALIMAAGVLITILVASLWIFVFRQMASGVSDVNKIMETSEITEFNQQFLKYDGRGTGKLVNKPLDIHDVITIINISKNNDQQGTYPVHVEVNMENPPQFKKPLDNTVDLTTWTNDELKALMLSEINNGNTKDKRDDSDGETHRKYSCEVKYSVTDDRFVDKVIITRIN